MPQLRSSIVSFHLLLLTFLHFGVNDTYALMPPFLRRAQHYGLGLSQHCVGIGFQQSRKIKVQHSHPPQALKTSHIHGPLISAEESTVCGSIFSPLLSLGHAPPPAALQARTLEYV
ncbi:hypothetical protein EYF80_012504 [Liparis tanakae]|uniref:Secreted protein n=1 Tax=Liparis tanakae TaxID=230148 RepID=A0A4Z2IHC0_9TELE|nr:hypothetical protein EYF80_012504 [Liparis tanakae]